MGSTDDLLEEPIRFLDLVPIKEIRLTELEVLQLIGFDQWNTENVCRCEEPATSGRPLVRDWSAFHWHGEIKDVLVPVEGVIVDEYVCKRVASETCNRQAVLSRAPGEGSH